MDYDAHAVAWQIADNYLELRKDRRAELVSKIKEELEYLAMKVAVETVAEMQRARGQ